MGAVERKTYTDEQRDQAVNRYLEGASYATIARELGIPKQTIHTWVQDRGLRPRSRRWLQPDNITASQLVEQLSACERERGALQARLEIVEAELARAKARTSSRAKG